jgi:hypothetical protein
MGTSDRSAGFALVFAVVVGAIGGGAIWYGLSTVVINGRNIMERVAWPLNTAVPYAVVGAALNGIAVVRSNRRSRSLRDDLHGVAGELGLAYEEGQVEVALEARPRTSLLAQWGRCENRLSGMNDGVRAQMFELTTISKGGDSAVHRPWTVVLFEQTRLPVFACFPNTWWTLQDRSVMTPVSFDPAVGDETTREAVAGFQKAYQVCLHDTARRSDEDEVRQLFRAPRLAVLARHPGWAVESADGCLVFARRGIASASDRAALWREAGELRRALLAPASSSVRAIPAAAGMERSRERNRRIGRKGGGIAGVMVGFFGTFIAFATVMVNQGRMLNPLIFFAFVPVVLGGLVVGGLSGAWAGELLAARFLRPAADGASAPKIGWGWVVAGGFVGWIIGLAVGMGLAMMITKHIRAGWVFPVVFFSTPVLCLVLGGFAGQRVSRWWDSRRRRR